MFENERESERERERERESERERERERATHFHVAHSTEQLDTFISHLPGCLLDSDRNIDNLELSNKNYI